MTFIAALASILANEALAARVDEIRARTAERTVTIVFDKECRTLFCDPDRPARTPGVVTTNTLYDETVRALAAVVKDMTAR